MDIDIIYKSLIGLFKVFEKLLLIPFLVVFGFLSRVSWDWLQNGIVPSKKKVGALFILSVFSSVVFLLLMRSNGMTRENMELGIPFVAFFGHNIWTFLMEHKNEILRKLLDFGISIISSFKKK